jgi:hypothetical protein
MTQAALVLLFVSPIGIWILTRNPRRKPLPDLPQELFELQRKT